jgi:hypothetical protein
MSCPNITIIDREQCIGNSLAIINDNFTSLRDGICDNIDRITNLESQSDQLNSSVISLSSIVVPGVAKAWVKFDGTRDTTGASTPLGFRFIYSKYNIEEVDDYFAGSTLAQGFYRIDFQNFFENTNYLVLGTSSETTTGGQYTWVQPVEYTDSFVVIKVANSLGQAVAATHISVVIF